jgi:hypothetical protein
MTSGLTTSTEVEKLLALPTRRRQRLIVQMLKASGQASMSRDRIVAAIASDAGVTQLRGAARAQFTKNINAAIGVLLRKSPPVLKRRGTTNTVVALVNGTAAIQPRMRTRILTAVRDRLVSIRFHCAGCGSIVETSNLDDEGWCDCLHPYHERGRSLRRRT